MIYKYTYNLLKTNDHRMVEVTRMNDHDMVPNVMRMYTSFRMCDVNE